MATKPSAEPPAGEHKPYTCELMQYGEGEDLRTWTRWEIAPDVWVSTPTRGHDEGDQGVEDYNTVLRLIARLRSLTTPPGEAEKHGWTIHHGITCVECPECAFMMDAGHTSEPDGEHYECPNCSTPGEEPTPSVEEAPDEMVCPVCEGKPRSQPDDVCIACTDTGKLTRETFLLIWRSHELAWRELEPYEVTCVEHEYHGYAPCMDCEAVEQPEPVAWRYRYSVGGWWVTTSNPAAKGATTLGGKVEPLYTEPPIAPASLLPVGYAKGDALKAFLDGEAPGLIVIRGPRNALEQPDEWRSLFLEPNHPPASPELEKLREAMEKIVNGLESVGPEDGSLLTPAEEAAWNIAREALTAHPEEKTDGA